MCVCVCVCVCVCMCPDHLPFFLCLPVRPVTSPFPRAFFFLAVEPSMLSKEEPDALSKAPATRRKLNP